MHTGKRRKTQEGAEIEWNPTEIKRKWNGNEQKRRKKQDNARKCGKNGTTLENITKNERNSKTTKGSI
jgi:hypothetical protein